MTTMLIAVALAGSVGACFGFTIGAFFGAMRNEAADVVADAARVAAFDAALAARAVTGQALNNNSSTSRVIRGGRNS